MPRRVTIAGRGPVRAALCSDALSAVPPASVHFAGDTDQAAVTVAAAHRKFPFFLDPPEQTQIRDALAPLLAGVSHPALSRSVRNLTVPFLRGADGNGEVELVDALLRPVASRVMAQLLGIDERHCAHLSTCSKAIGVSLDDFSGRRLARYRALANADDALRDLRQLATPPGLNGPAFAGVLFAGLETLTNALGVCLLALAQQPGPTDQPRWGPGRIPAALRQYPPIRAVSRTARAPIRIGEYDLAREDRVDILLDSGGIGLIFGAGVHACPGRSMALTAIHAVLGSFLARPTGPTLTLCGGHPMWHPSRSISGLARLDVLLSVSI